MGTVHNLGHQSRSHDIRAFEDVFFSLHQVLTVLYKMQYGTFSMYTVGALHAMQWYSEQWLRHEKYKKIFEVFVIMKSIIEASTRWHTL